ncbi:DUF1737 domain-containing protein [Nocardia wallacei]|uniref:DUF1737 domain-containing protein n=1 Tax=Nocardia wallacei TaxID=480035 RepID=UPI00245719C2|nr:DUF1737 domain-containing protein [Nocardia wallacei]
MTQSHATPNPARAFFDEVRNWAYPVVVHYDSKETFAEAVLEQARQINLAGKFRRTSEQIDRAATTISGWVWEKFVADDTDRAVDQPSVEDEPGKTMRYRFISHIPGRPELVNFDDLVNELLAKGWELYGAPCLTFNGMDPIAGQALIRRPAES